MSPKANQSQTQIQKLSPQQIIQANIIQLNNSLLEQRIIKELEDNPILEIADDESGEENSQEVIESSQDEAEFDWDELDSDSDRFELPSSIPEDSPDAIILNHTAPKTLSDKIKDQLQDINVSDEQMLIAFEIIGNLDDDGYFKMEPILIADKLGKQEFDVLSVLAIIQSLNPPGIASRNLKECLLAQIDEVKENLSFRVINEYFDEFLNKKYELVSSGLDCSDSELQSAIDVIKKKNPKPGDGLLLGENEVIVPDIVMIRRQGEWIIQLNDGSIYDLRINEKYVDMLKEKQLDKETRKFIKGKTEAANWFIQAIKQRKETLVNVMSCIVLKQKEMFDSEEFQLNPMALKDVAENLCIDISTVSRATRGKYVQLPWGTYELKDFFTDSISMSDGTRVSNSVVKNRIQSIVDNEDKSSPLNDKEITKMLIKEGFLIARRTVSKYRDMLCIPKTKLRREIKNG